MIKFSDIHKIEYDGDFVNLFITCPICHKEYCVTISSLSYEKLCTEYFCENKMIQNIFPQWNPILREVFISGVCRECQEEIFSYNDEDDCEVEDE